MSSTIKILVNAATIVTNPDDKLKSTQELEATIKRAYDEHTNDPECYATWFEIINLGTIDPDAIKELAQDWNNELHSDLKDAIMKWSARYKNSAPEQALDNTLTYNLLKAVMAANDAVHDFAHRLLFNMPNEHDPEDSDWVFRSILPQHALDDIMQNPKNYAYCELSVK